MRYRFLRDDDGHWYMIPADKMAGFNKWVEMSGNVYYAGDDSFDDYRLGGGIHNYTFTDPQEEL